MIRRRNKKTGRSLRRDLKSVLGKHDWAMRYVYEPGLWSTARRTLNAYREFRHRKPRKNEMMEVHMTNYFQSRLAESGFADRILGMMQAIDDGGIKPLTPKAPKHIG